MKYKYTGRVPAVVLVEDEFLTLQPGDIREFIIPPASTHFITVGVDGKKEKKAVKKISQKKEKINATNADTSSLG